MENKEMVDLQVWRLVFNSTQPEATPSGGILYFVRQAGGYFLDAMNINNNKNNK